MASPGAPEATCAVRVDGAVFCWGSNASGQLGDGTTTDRRTPRQVPSFLANVDPTADLASNGHRVLLTAVVNCPVDHTVAIEMTLRTRSRRGQAAGASAVTQVFVEGGSPGAASPQDAVSGAGQAGGKCRGGLTEYPVEVSVRQGAPFEVGQARAEIIATVREGHKVVDVQEWQREVEIDPAP